MDAQGLFWEPLDGGSHPGWRAGELGRGVVPRTLQAEQALKPVLENGRWHASQKCP